MNWLIRLKKFIPPSLILLSHHIRGIVAAYWYGFPAKRLKVVGVTGTNGKTTTCNLIARILEEAGYRVAMATTINFKIGNKEWVNKTKMTTISPFALQKFLFQAVNNECHYAVLEVTSHALTQNRVWGIKFDVVVLTNLTHEHLDYHRNFETYRSSKEKLFKNVPKAAVINSDDQSKDFFLRHPANQTLTYGLENKPKLLAKKIIYQPTATHFTVITPKGQTAINLKLPGKFNVYNALAALGAGLTQNIKLDIIKYALEEVQVIPGRMEKIDVGQPFKVIIDYAHTPDALQQIYETLVPSLNGRLISVLGACGDRDKTKRPIMGALAGRYADLVIITNEDPYTEDPQAIIDQVAAGVPRGALKDHPKKLNENFFIFPDREVAIRKALEHAQKGDLVLITGKGAETWMVVGREKIPWSDRKIVEEILSSIK